MTTITGKQIIAWLQKYKADFEADVHNQANSTDMEDVQLMVSNAESYIDLDKEYEIALNPVLEPIEDEDNE